MLAYIQYYVLDYFDLDTISFIAVFITLLIGIGAITLYGIACGFKNSITFRKSLHISSATGISMFFVSVGVTTLLYNGGIYSDTDSFLFMGVVLPALFLATLFIRRSTSLSSARALILAAVTMSLTYLLGILILFAFFHYFSTSMESMTLITPSAVEDQTDIEFTYKEVFEAKPYTLVCKSAVYSESDACNLFARDKEGNYTDLHFFSEVVKKAVLISPDKAHVLLVSEHVAIVLNVSNLKQKKVLEVPNSIDLGVLSEQPSFYPQAKWLDKDTIQISTYSQNTMVQDTESPGHPMEVKTISI